MKNNLKRKRLVCEIVPLIVCFSIVPTINILIVRAHESNDLIKVTTQVYDSSGENSQTIQLTTEQVHEVKMLFDSLKNRFSKAESMEATREIFSDTVVCLSQYHLLPKDMGMRDTQRVVTGGLQNHNIETLFYGKSKKFPGDSDSAGEIQNYFCYIAGNTTNTHFAKPITKITLRLFDIMDFSSGNILILKIATVLWIISSPFSTMSQLILKHPGHHIGVNIHFGNYHYYPYPNWFSPAQGWLLTNGLNGKQNITGSFWGQEMTSGWQPQDDWNMNYSWRGCVGFTGIITYINQDSAYYIGSALQVHVGPNRP
jgi:hypothetical protein